jgi:hypothetical protein
MTTVPGSTQAAAPGTQSQAGARAEVMALVPSLRQLFDQYLE